VLTTQTVTRRRQLLAGRKGGDAARVSGALLVVFDGELLSRYKTGAVVAEPADMQAIRLA
jgi:hypothetical protein